jgi:hypothetical protein
MREVCRPCSAGVQSMLKHSAHPRLTPQTDSRETKQKTKVTQKKYVLNFLKILKIFGKWQRPLCGKVVGELPEKLRG